MLICFIQLADVPEVDWCADWPLSSLVPPTLSSHLLALTTHMVDVNIMTGDCCV